MKNLLLIGLLTLSVHANASLDDFNNAMGAGDFASSELVDKPFYPSSSDVINDSINTSCIDYEFIGACIWLKCGIWGCKVVTTPIAKHYIPDTMIAVMSQSPDEQNKAGGGKNNAPFPTTWSNLAGGVTGMIQSLLTTISDQLSTLSGGLFNTVEGFTSQTAAAEQAGVYQEALALGHPEAALVNQAQKAITRATMGMVPFCDMRTIPAKPYYSSSADFIEWRYGVIETLRMAIDAGGSTFNMDLSGGTRIGYFNNTTNLSVDKWDYLYPRTGVTSNPDHYRASGMVASRVAHIITRDNQIGRIYEKLPSGKKNYQWLEASPYEIKKQDNAGTIHDNLTNQNINVGVYRTDANTGKWQQNYPRKKGDACYVFPDFEQTQQQVNGVTINKELEKRRSNAGNYLYSLWRKYECCIKPSRSQYLGKIKWASSNSDVDIRLTDNSGTSASVNVSTQFQTNPNATGYENETDISMQDLQNLSGQATIESNGWPDGVTSDVDFDDYRPTTGGGAGGGGGQAGGGGGT
ncbi:TraU family protein [Motilimonas eburnea]|uniref:TraU family protein n=1 Tax=Motilimonas eburnea TaxID=1737488 RepID=UPI001E37C650|nr:TraU family protein [Motilimonas eburnea]